MHHTLAFKLDREIKDKEEVPLWQSAKNPAYIVLSAVENGIEKNVLPKGNPVESS